MGNKCFTSSFSSKDENTPDAGVPSEAVEDENTLDLSDLSKVVKDKSDIEELISFIQQKLEACTVDTTTSWSQQDPSTSQENGGTSQQPVVASRKIKSCANFGKDLLGKVLKRVQKDTSERPYRLKLGEKTRRSIIDILKESVKIHWLGAGLSVLGYVLEHIGQVSKNEKQCVELLRYMLALAKHVIKLNEELPENREKFNAVVDFIVQGCLMCVSQMTNHSLFRFISASVDGEEIKQFESQLGQKYQDLNMEAVIGLLNRTPHFLPPTQGRNPDAVGIEKAHDTVTRLLQVEVNDQTRRAVVIYGFGGVGKTTLATSVFNQLNLNAYKFSRLDMEESCSNEHIKLLQQQLLLDLFGQKNMLRSHVEGQDQLTNAFSRGLTQSVFLFIDNALKKDDLAKLLPQNISCLPKQSRILLTTRKLDESSMFLQPGIQRHEYRVECLNSEESKQILCKKALGSVDATFHPGVDIDGLVKICGGIPLVLNLVGSRLSEQFNDVSICNEMIDSLRESLIEGEGDEGEEISEKVVDVVYNSLNENCKQAFLDIACFFYNTEHSFVSCVVGELQLKTLENAALVKISHEAPTSISLLRGQPRDNLPGWNQFVRGRDAREGFLEVHDIVRARGRKLSRIQKDRIMDMESWAEAVQHTQNLQKIKGICIRSTSEFQIDAEHLDFTHASLRTLYIEGKIKFNGKCRKDFKNLKCIYLPFNTCSFVDLANLKRLAVLRAEFSNNPTELPSSLHVLDLRPVSDCQLSLNASFGKPSSLQELHLRNVELPRDFGHLKCLRLLRFHNCKVVTLSQSFGSLSALEGLSIIGCKELESLPMSFDELQKLAFLEVMFCPKMSSLSENFGQLTSLRILNLWGCEGLSTLPESFGNLSSLEELSLMWCSKLVSLLESFGNLSYLKELEMGGCEQLARLPNNFGQLKSLKDLSIHNCCRLERLSSDFGCLTSLERLWATNCFDLKEEAMDVLVEMKNLKVVDIFGSPMLIERWKESGEPLLASGNPVSLFG